MLDQVYIERDPREIRNIFEKYYYFLNDKKYFLKVIKTIFYSRRVLHAEEWEIRPDREQSAAQLLQHQPQPAATPPSTPSAPSHPASWEAEEERAQSGRGDEEILPGRDLRPDQAAGSSHRGRRGEDVAGAILQW